MTETLRAFVAIELPTDVTSSLAELTERIGRAGAAGVRTVRAEAIHLTLRFLGAVPAVKVDTIVAALRDVARDHRSFTLRLGEVGAFPTRGTPRVLWVGIDGDLDALQLLRRDIEDALERRLDFEREERRFSPHLTLARIRPSSSRADGKRALGALVSAKVDVGLPIPVSSISLLHSILRPEGAVHIRLASLPLGVESPRDGGA